MTGQEYFEFINKHQTKVWAATATLEWDQLPENYQLLYSNIAEELPLMFASDIFESVASLAKREQHLLYKFLHDACGCRMY